MLGYTFGSIYFLSRSNHNDNIYIYTNYNSFQITRNDGFPQHMCGDCKRMLTVVTEFRELCKRSDDELRSMEHYLQISDAKPAKEHSEGSKFDEEMRTMDEHHLHDSDIERQVDEVDYLEEAEDETIEPVDMRQVIYVLNIYSII